MASSLQYDFRFRKVLVVYLVLFLFSSVLVCAFSESQYQREGFVGSRKALLKIQEEEDGDGSYIAPPPPPKKKSTAILSKNQTKLTKPSTNSTTTTLKKTQLNKKTNSTSSESSNPITTSPISSTKTQLKKLNSTSKSSNSTTQPQLKKLIPTSKSSDSAKPTSKSSNSTKPTSKSSNSTKPTSKSSNSIKPTSKSSNSTKPTSLLSKKSQDLIKTSNSKNKTTKATSSKLSLTNSVPKNLQIGDKKLKTTQKPKQPDWIDEEEDYDFVADIRDLPSKFHKNLFPDLQRISTTSQAYLNKANKEITSSFKPIVGKKYAPAIASFVCFTFILIPLLLVSLLVNRIKTYFSLQKVLIFVQAYLFIYFSILCLSAIVTGLEPLRFFYATSQVTYVCVQALQTLAYVFYLLLLIMYLLLVFSTDCGLGSKCLGLVQTLVGYAVGLHYYVAVFHRAVLHQPPKTNWRVHGAYATCFLVICLLAQADRRKKTYLEEGGEEGKKN